MLWQYLTRVAPALSLLFLVVLIVLSFAIQPFGAGSKGQHGGSPTIWQVLLGIHILVLHAMSTTFPVRAFYSLKGIMAKMNEGDPVGGYAIGTRQQHLHVSHEKQDVSSLVFVIIIPSYKEDMDTLRTTLSVLAAHPGACSAYHVRSSDVVLPTQ